MRPGVACAVVLVGPNTVLSTAAAGESVKDQALILNGHTLWPAEDVDVRPGSSRRLTVALPAEALKAPVSFHVAARLFFRHGEAGGDRYALGVTVNGTALTDKYLPSGWPATLRTPHHPARKSVPLCDPSSQTWLVFCDDDWRPSGFRGDKLFFPKNPFFFSDLKEYLYQFPVGPLLRPGKNVIEIRNDEKANPERFPLQVLSEKSYAAGLKKAEDRLVVPDDRLLAPVRKFRRPDAKKLKEQLLVVHKLQEGVYNGDGSWSSGNWDWTYPGMPKDEREPYKKQVTHPLVRHTSGIVQAYLLADSVEPNLLFRRRAREGMEWLLKKQEGDGSYQGAFRWYKTNEGILLPGPCLYTTAYGGRVLAAGYEAFKDARYLEGSWKAADWLASAPVDPNANYNMLAVWHLAAHYRLVKDRKYLDAAVARTLATLKDQSAGGAWSDHHNMRIGYHGHIVQGLVALLSIMPEGHADKPTIRKGALRAVNHVIAEQREDGSLRNHPIGRPGKGTLSGNLVLVPVLVEAERRLGWELGEVIAGLIQAPVTIDGSDSRPVTVGPAAEETWRSTLQFWGLFHATSWQWAREQEEGRGKR